MSSNEAVEGSETKGDEASVAANSWNQEKPRHFEPWLDGNYDRPHVEKPNEVNFLGGLGPRIGHARSRHHIVRPTPVQQLYNMRIKNRTWFTFTEVPAQTSCIVAKKEKIDHTNVLRIRQAVDRCRLAENVQSPHSSTASVAPAADGGPVELFDAENPLQLDLQGLDRKQTFVDDEQEHQNRLEYERQKHHFELQRLLKSTDWRHRQLQHKYGLPPYFDTDQMEGTEVDLLAAPKELWTDKYRFETGAGGASGGAETAAEQRPQLQRPVPEMVQHEVTEVADLDVLGALVRTADKPKHIERERKRRERLDERFTAMKLHQQEKLSARRHAREKQLADEQEDKMMKIGEMQFESSNVDELTVQRQLYEKLQPLYERTIYPHTRRETNFARRVMNRERRVRRDECAMRKEFAGEQLEKLGTEPLDTTSQTNDKQLAFAEFEREKRAHAAAAVGVCTQPPAADDSDATAVELSEQSSDDADGLSVGRTPSLHHCRLRNFHYKMGVDMRGIRTRKPQSKWDRAPRKCVTRAEWFDEMAPVRQPRHMNSMSSVPTKLPPSDPNYNIFTAGGIAAAHAGGPDVGGSRGPALAPIREMLLKRGERPGSRRKRVPRLKKPKYLKVCQFNMTAYMFGAQPRQRRDARAQTVQLGDARAKQEAAAALTRARKLRMRHNRMRVLGIPIVEWGKTTKAAAVNADDDDDENSDECDWVPERKPDKATLAAQAAAARAQERPEFDELGNRIVYTEEEELETEREACAPDFREPITAATRALYQKSDETDPRFPYDVPRLDALEADRIVPGQADRPRTEFTDMLSSRAHHQHRDATQHKTVHVRYLPKIPQTQVPTAASLRNARPPRSRPFEAARFRGGEPLREDLALPSVKAAAQTGKLADMRFAPEEVEPLGPETGEPAAQKQKPASATRSSSATAKNQYGTKKKPNKDHKQPDKSHAVAAAPVDPKKAEYLDIIRVRNAAAVAAFFAVDSESKQRVVVEQRHVLDELEVMRKLREELDSIASCNSTLSSRASSCGAGGGGGGGDGRNAAGATARHSTIRGGARKSHVIRASDAHRGAGDSAGAGGSAVDDDDALDDDGADAQSTTCSDDSGSYLELQGQKVPCAFVNRSTVPFEEIDRCRMAAEPIVEMDEYNGAYFRMPFAGQRPDMRELCRPKDQFFTAGCRDRNDIRERLVVKRVPFDGKLFGFAKSQVAFVSQLATQWDEYYQHEIQTRPRNHRFKARATMQLARDALRKRFQSQYIQESIVEHKILQKLHQTYEARVERFRDMCLPLFTEWQELAYRACMKKMQALKPIYDQTEALRKQAVSVEAAHIKLRMSIIYLEDDWRRRTIMQNFHFLLADLGWRKKHDWVHVLKAEAEPKAVVDPADADDDVDADANTAADVPAPSRAEPAESDEATPATAATTATTATTTTTQQQQQQQQLVLEDFTTSIRKRPTENLRVRDQDSAWAVKAFYDQFYEERPAAATLLYPFHSAEEFRVGLAELTSKSFVCLLELHHAMWVLANVQHAYREFQRFAADYTARREKFVKTRCGQKYFHDQLGKDLERAALEMLGEPLEAAVTAPVLRQTCALCETLYVQMIPQAVRDNMPAEADVLDKFQMVAKLALERLDGLEIYPLRIRIAVERRVRKCQTFEMRRAVHASDIRYRIDQTVHNLKINLAPISKPKPVRPLQRSHCTIVRRKKPPVEHKLTDADRLFYKAFTDQPPPITAAEHSKEDAQMLKSLTSNCIPFYFEFFLQLRNYFPEYNFKTQVELSDGNEFERFKYEDVFDIVKERLRRWELIKEVQMKEHIKQTWHLYKVDDD